MIQINWIQVGSYITIIILSILLFQKCDNNKIAYIKISKLQEQKYVNHINTLNDKITVLNRLKQVEKTKIVTVIKEVEKKIVSVGTLNTKGIANYYQDRYKLPIVITKYGVSLSDTIAKKNIVELIKKDGLVLELNHTKNILNIAENQLNIKDEIIVMKDSVIVEKDKIENILTKSVKSERTKKNLWKLVSAGVLAGFILVR